MRGIAVTGMPNPVQSNAILASNPHPIHTELALFVDSPPCITRTHTHRRADRRRNKGNDPLQTFEGAATGDSAGAGESTQGDVDGAEDEKPEVNDRIYTASDDVGVSSSGRNLWKMKHRKGEYNPMRSRETRVDAVKGATWNSAARGNGKRRR